ncbi:hypothetical protein PG984_012970 [Apiospora sp. TS-2023a]
MATVNDTHKPYRPTSLQSENLPLRVEDVTAEWCSKMLDGAPVADVKIISAQHGSSSSLVVELTYEVDDPYDSFYSADSPMSEESFESLNSITSTYPNLSRSARSSISSASYSSTQLSRSARSSISSTSSTSTTSTFSSSSTLNQSHHPSRVFFKGGLNPELAALAPFLQATYRREAEFYHHLAPTLRNADVRLPESYFSGVDAVSGQGIVVLEDLAASGCTFGKPEQPLSVDQVRAGVEQLARLHAATWSGRHGASGNGAAVEDAYPWLQQQQGGSLRDIVRELLKSGPFDAVAPRNIGGPDGDRFQEHASLLLDRERIRGAFESLWNGSDNANTSPSPSTAAFQCIVHGDPHIVNTFLTPAGEPGFLDWQTLARGNGSHDVAYFVASALTVENRRTHEQSIVRSYVEALLREGGPCLKWEDAWLEYRKHLLHGYVLCLAQPGMQSQENIWVLTERYVTAILDRSVDKLFERADLT